MVPNPLLIHNAIMQILSHPPLGLFPTRNNHCLHLLPLLLSIPFMTPKIHPPLVCSAATKAIVHPNAQQSAPVVQNAPSSWYGTKTASKQWTGSTSASCSMSEAPAPQ